MGLYTPQERLMTPPRWTGVDESLRVAFLLGPIQGAPDFQTSLARRIIEKTEDVFVASPRRLEIDENFDYDEQVDWEQNNLARAAFNGVTLAWFAARDFKIPYDDKRPFGKTSFGEINQVFIRKAERPSVRVHLGIHPEYTASGGISERYIRTMARRAGVPVHDSLTAVEAAVLDDLAQF